jgi:hypothetical protein
MITERCARPLDPVHQTDQVIHPAVSPAREENTKRKITKKKIIWGTPWETSRIKHKAKLLTVVSSSAFTIQEAKLWEIWAFSGPNAAITGSLRRGGKKLQNTSGSARCTVDGKREQKA